MQRLAFLLLATIFVSSCNRPAIPILNANNLPSSFITIDAGKDYQLKTFKGAVVKIAANSFDVPTGTAVRIEMKEAYSIGDILAGGLSTKSDGKLLQSGGMVYFNATANGKAVDFLKPVSVTTPSSVYNQDMQLFKGEMGKDSSINWVKPAPLDTTPIAKYIGNGGALFKANCANCHKPLENATGPALAGARDRAPHKAWVYKFVNNVNAMIDTDPYARKLKRQYGGAVMTQFNLPEWDIKAILDYCDNQAALYKPQLLNGSRFIPSATDSLNERKYAEMDCGYDTVAVPVFDSSFETDTSVMAVDYLLDTTSYEMPEMPMYSFNIDRNGWYNIDCFIDANAALVSDVELKVKVIGAASADNTEVYLCIPTRKLLTSGYFTLDGFWEFYEPDGKIKLIPGDKAFVFAVVNDKDNISFGSKSFNVETKQLLNLNIKISSEEKILDAFKRNNLEGVKIDVSKNAIEMIIAPAIQDSVDSTAPPVELQIIKKACSDSMSTYNIYAAKK